LEFYRPASDSVEMKHLLKKRADLGGVVPRRVKQASSLNVPEIGSYAQFAFNTNGRSMSSTMAFVRMLAGLLQDPELGRRVVPIVADEARTFGMASLFRQVGIYSPLGQLYEPEDSSSLLA